MSKQIPLFKDFVDDEEVNKLKIDNLTQIGSSAHADHKRVKDDFYETPQSAVINFLNCYSIRDKEVLDKTIWECACGEGAISKVLENYGYDVISTDYVDRGYGNQQDFLISKSPNMRFDIITNPPFKLINEFLLKAFDLVNEGNRVIFLMRLLCLEGKARQKIFEKYPIKYVYVHTSRIACSMPNENGKPKTSAIAYAWFVWQKGYKGETITRWLP